MSIEDALERTYHPFVVSKYKSAKSTYYRVNQSQSRSGVTGIRHWIKTHGEKALDDVELNHLLSMVRFKTRRWRSKNNGGLEIYLPDLSKKTMDEFLEDMDADDLITYYGDSVREFTRIQMAAVGDTFYLLRKDTACGERSSDGPLLHMEKYTHNKGMILKNYIKNLFNILEKVAVKFLIDVDGYEMLQKFYNELPKFVNSWIDKAMKSAKLHDRHKTYRQRDVMSISHHTSPEYRRMSLDDYVKLVRTRLHDTVGNEIQNWVVYMLPKIKKLHMKHSDITEHEERKFLEASMRKMFAKNHNGMVESQVMGLFTQGDKHADIFKTSIVEPYASEIGTRVENIRTRVEREMYERRKRKDLRNKSRLGTFNNVDNLIASYPKEKCMRDHYADEEEDMMCLTCHSVDCERSRHGFKKGDLLKYVNHTDFECPESLFTKKLNKDISFSRCVLGMIKKNSERKITSETPRGVFIVRNMESCEKDGGDTTRLFHPEKHHIRYKKIAKNYAKMKNGDIYRFHPSTNIVHLTGIDGKEVVEFDAVEYKHPKLENFLFIMEL
jgi:hypothetical protein